MLAVALWFVCGLAAGRALPSPRRISDLLNRWVVQVALPALILAKLPSLALDGRAAVPIVMAWVTVAAGAALAQFVAARASLPTETKGALLLLVPLGNTSFLGLPVVEAVLGADHLPAALAFDQIGTFLALATWGSWVAGRFGHGETGLRPVFDRLRRFPPFVALLASFVLRAVDMPGAVHDVLAAAGKTVAPVAIVSLGIRFVPRLRINNGRLVAAALVAKMVVLPALVLVIAAAVGDPGAAEWRASVLESAMPPMVTAGILGITAGFDEELITTLVAAGTVVGIIAMSLVSLWV